MVGRPLILDDEICRFTKNSVLRGYLKNEVPKTLASKIADLLKNGDLQKIVKGVPLLVKNPAFRQARKRYELKRVRYNAM